MKIEDFTGKLSKKLTLAVTSVLFIFMTEWMGMDITFEQLAGITGIVVTYLVGQSAIDLQKEKK